MKTADFKEAFIATNSYEGGYSNNPYDRGGETYAGISLRHWPLWRGWEIIERHKHSCTANELAYTLDNDSELNELVYEFYEEHFWVKNSLMMFSQAVANELYDTGVNQGVVTAATHLQRALNLLNRDERDYKNIKVDGCIGVKTIRAYEYYMSTSRLKYRNKSICTKWLLKLLNYYQCALYVGVAEQDATQEIFLPGWLKRV